MKDQIKNIIDNIYPLSENSLLEISGNLELEIHPKGKTFITKDKKEEKGNNE